MDHRQQKPQPIPRHHPPGEILLNAMYRADELKSRMGWSDAAFRAAKGRGLKVRREGKRVYIFGSDVIEYLKTRTEDPPPVTDKPTCAGR